jgi:hypothetical protein
MTVSATDYTALITSEHAGQPNFTAMVALLTQPFCDLQNFYASMPTAFCLDYAVGAQLDIVGQWIGLSRQLPFPLGDVYFSWDTSNLGWDQGSWQGPYDPTTGIVSLDDTTYRTVLYAKVGANNWDGTLPTMQTIIQSLFPESTGTLVFVQDGLDMSITVGLVGTPPSALLSAFLGAGLFPLRPEGVLVNYVYVPTPGPAFGWDIESDLISGWDVGAWVAPL